MLLHVIPAKVAMTKMLTAIQTRTVDFGILS